MNRRDTTKAVSPRSEGAGKLGAPFQELDGLNNYVRDV